MFPADGGNAKDAAAIPFIAAASFRRERACKPGFVTRGARRSSFLWKCGYPHPQATYPEGTAGPAPSLFGLAPNGVCRACRIAAASGGLLLHRFTLTACAAVCFLWRCPRVAPPGRYPASCPAEPGLSSPGLAARSDDPSRSRRIPARTAFGKGTTRGGDTAPPGPSSCGKNAVLPQNDRP